MDRPLVTQLYAQHLRRPENADKVAAIRAELRGKDLACWCPLDEACHGDVLLEIANSEGALT